MIPCPLSKSGKRPPKKCSNWQLLQQCIKKLELSHKSLTPTTEMWSFVFGSCFTRVHLKSLPDLCGGPLGFWRCSVFTACHGKYTSYKQSMHSLHTAIWISSLVRPWTCLCSVTPWSQSFSFMKTLHTDWQTSLFPFLLVSFLPVTHDSSFPNWNDVNYGLILCNLGHHVPTCVCLVMAVEHKTYCPLENKQVILLSFFMWRCLLYTTEHIGLSDKTPADW